MKDEAGIVTMGGGRYLPYAFCLVRSLRAKSCRLPVTVYYCGAAEAPPPIVAGALDCRFVDAAPFGRRGWGAKAACILHAPYRRVLWNDADAFWLTDGTWMFAAPELREFGAMFWPCPAYFPRTPIWDVAGRVTS